MKVADQPLATATVDTWEDAEAHIKAHTSSKAWTLSELTARMGEEYHHLVLDPESRTVWYAWTLADELTDEPWTIEQLTPQAAADLVDPYVDMVEDAMDNPAQYAEGFGDLDSDQAAMDENSEILLLSLNAEDPTAAAAQIKRHREVLRREDARWQRTYAHLVRDLAGDERGGKTRAARALRVSDMQVGRIIRQDDERREQLAAEVQEAREQHAGDQ